MMSLSLLMHTSLDLAVRSEELDCNFFTCLGRGSVVQCKPKQKGRKAT